MGNGIRRGEGLDFITVTADTGRDAHTRYVYDSGNRLQWKAGSLGQVTGYHYDSHGNLIKEIAYDTRIAPTAAPHSVQASSADQVSLMAYDSGNRLIYQIDATGQLTQRIYDANGNAVKRIAYATLLARPTATDTAPSVTALAAQVVTDAANDHVLRSVYDAANREIYSIDSTGAVIAQKYDAMGNIIDRIAYATRIATSTAATTTAIAAAIATIADATRDNHTRYVYDNNQRVIASTDSANGTTQYTYDTSGNLIKRVAPNGSVVKQMFDASNNLIASLDGAGDLLTYTYDGAGNLLDRTIFAKAIASNSFSTMPATASWQDAQVRTVHDVAHRLNYTIDSAGAVIAQKYDAMGNLIDRIAYANPLPASTPATADAVAAAISTLADSSRDVHTRSVFDQSNRLIWRINGQGSVTGFTYDTAGNLIKQVQYATPIDAAADPAAVAASPADRISLMAYDSGNRLVYEADAEGTVTGQVFDAFGNVTKRTVYAKKINTSTVGSTAFDGAAIAAAIVSDPADRTSHQTFDSQNRLIYSVDALGYVQKNQYDALGNITAHIQFADTATSKLPTNLDGVSTALLNQFLDQYFSPDSKRDQIDKFTYDSTGRLLTSQDALGAKETYTYNPAGQKSSFTNKKGDLWTYLYDAAGRLTQETAPAVPGQSGQYQLITRYQYDGLSNLIARTEAFGRPEERTTTYAYDGRGHQIQVTYPPRDGYQILAGKTVYQTGANAADAPADAPAVAPIVSSTTYDALGRAVANADIVGKLSYKAYDALGQVRYDVDAEGNVTGYTRNAYGEVTALTRYAAAITLTAADKVLSVADIETRLGALEHSQDRTIVTVYDHRARVAEVRQPAQAPAVPAPPSASSTTRSAASPP